MNSKMALTSFAYLMIKSLKKSIINDDQKQKKVKLIVRKFPIYSFGLGYPLYTIDNLF